MSSKINVLISHGIGKLHFFEAVKSLSSYNHNITVITGFIPSEKYAFLIDKIGDLFGHKNLFKRLHDRSIKMPNCQIVKLSNVELFHHLFYNALNKFIFFKYISFFTWTMWAFFSKKFLIGNEILHVRSGVGGCGLTDKARLNRIKIIVDHSILHPRDLEDILKKEYVRVGLNWRDDYNQKFWDVILSDCNKADIILVNSEFVKSSFVNNGFNPDRIKVIYWGVNEKYIGLKTNYRIGNKIRLCFSGHFDIRKGAHIIIDALKLLKYEGIQFELNIFGYIKKSDFLDSLIKDVEEFINVYGFLPQEEMVKQIAQNDLFIFPTFAEGSSRSVMEAMALGIPVITTNNAGCPITHLENGIIIECGNFVMLKDSILMLYNNPTLMKKIGENASKLIKNDFKWKNYGEQLNELYNQLALK